MKLFVLFSIITLFLSLGRCDVTGDDSSPEPVEPAEPAGSEEPAEPAGSEEPAEEANDDNLDESVTYPLLVLEGEETIEIDQVEALNYGDPGGRVIGLESGVDEQVAWLIPGALKSGVVGTYEIELSSDLTENTVVRTVIVTDIDECALGHDPILGRKLCSPLADCINEEGGFSCECKQGYQGSGFRCYDVNECESDELNECDHEHGVCINIDGSYECSCNSGFVLADDGHSCNDVDECSTGAHNCDRFATCENLIGSFACECNEGFTGDGVHCEPVDRCENEENDCHEHAFCTMSPDADDESGYRCDCKTGFRDANDAEDVLVSGRDCVDINECEEDLHTCVNSQCVNTDGSYECVCFPGYEMDASGVCVDVDECATANDCNEFHAVCFNTPGGYDCSCQEGYVGDGKTCTPENEGFYIKMANSELVVNQCDTWTWGDFSAQTMQGGKESSHRVSRKVPTQLGSGNSRIAKVPGTFRVSFEAKAVVDGQEVVAQAYSEVRVLPINRCETSVEECRYQCPAQSTCTYDANATTEADRYSCLCDTPNYEPLYDNETGSLIRCIDKRAPEIQLKGPNPYVRRLCKVCSFTEELTAFVDPGYMAFDRTPSGVVDLTENVVVDIVQVDDNTQDITYTVADEEGNEVSVTRRITVEYEDVFEKVDKMWEEHNRMQNEYIYRVAMGIAIAVGGVVTGMLLPRLADLFMVFFSSGVPTYAKYQSGYSLIYAIRYPWLEKRERERMIHVNYTRTYHDKIDQ